MSNKIYINTPYIELDSLLKFTGVVFTGGEAKLIIKDGLVTVNGEICTMRKKKIYPNDCVEVENQKFIVFMQE